MMTVTEKEGGFVVIDDNSPNGSRKLAGPFPTHGEAWRALDRMEGEPISPAEKRADWISNKILSSGPKPKMPKSVRNEKKQTTKMGRAAAKAPKWVRDIAAAKFDPQGQRQHREWQLGTFGAASPVRKINPADYLASKKVSG
ncbi:hypothetical protein [Mesorhizobium sp.]|uniref:hypothetical protein n=2 Tax=Mesorhizobium sp. TaxID=1871066 RepID=UPI000FE857E0|nr:hypothetical protein [Mesorhizobium sp.]RWH32460.1 MAG: hypothetical protein EOQ76_03020 [Mesorhizobium sp.]RWH41174.1 MAG: hypothetical protein EOQ79_02050 [Mesorhizobium sp.]TIQ96128.1 MAG: hypothetical protein E5X36_21245 [Mesorhizobium sp.]